MARSILAVLDQLAKGVEELRVALQTARNVPNVEAGLTEGDDLKEIIEKVEQHVINRVMRKVRGNQVQGARLLNISRGSLIAKIKEYRIEDFRYLKRQDRTSRAARAARDRVDDTKRKSKARAKRPRQRRVSRPSPKLVLQGRYLGALRALPPRKRAQVKRVRAEKGTAAAITPAARLRG